MGKRRTVPFCLTCERKPARDLLGQGTAVFCSLRCAYLRLIENMMDWRFCFDCQEWYHGLHDGDDHRGHRNNANG